MEAIVYRFRTGIAWRDLPASFGPWQTVWKRHKRFSLDGTWDRIHARLVAEADAAGEVNRPGHGPGADALRALFLELSADEQPLRRLGELMAGIDVGGTETLAGGFLTDRVLRVEHHDPRFAGLLSSGRPVLLDLADRSELREVVEEWGDRVDVHPATIDDRPADALLIRPEAHIAWVAAIAEPTDLAEPALREALSAWFGTP